MHMKKTPVIDISNDTKTHYRIDSPGDFTYLFKNRSGEITFEILCEGVNLKIYGRYEGFQKNSFSIKTKQIHTTPKSSSRLIIKGVLWDASSLEHDGSISIQPDCNQSDAVLESRHLLMGERSQALARPQLEILAEDVRCSHAVTTSPPNEALIHYLSSRGLEKEAGKKLLACAFLTT